MMVDRSERLHTNIVKELYENPYKYLGFDEGTIKNKKMEYKMQGGGGKVIATPDLYIDSDAGEYYFEIKTSRKFNRRLKAEKQMIRMNYWLEKYHFDNYFHSYIFTVLPSGNQTSFKKIIDNLELIMFEPYYIQNNTL